MALMPPPLSLYIHFPWCVQKCPYCDFNSHQQNGELPEEVYINTLIRDLEQDLPQVWGRTLHSLFMGGGTPSLFSPKSLDRLLSAVRALIPVAPDAEITMEANPGTLEYAAMDEYRSTGINRLSLGVQSFHDQLLKKIGRIHSADEARHALVRARNGGFERINIDLMYALPGQSIAQACDDVQQALDLEVSHLSHYQLTIEPNTLFHAKPPSLPSHDAVWDYQLQCQQLIEKAGLQQYEVSAYARPGQESRHNLNYWQFGDYLGIGAGAHGKISSGASGQVVRTVKQKHPKSYLQSVESGARVQEQRTVNEQELGFEFVLNALRLNQGFQINDYIQRTGLSLDLSMQPWVGLIQDNLLEQHGSSIRATTSGRNYLNEVTERFL